MTSDLIVVLDGATVRTDTGCVHGAAWYARKLGAGLISAAADPAISLEEALAVAIQEVATLHPRCNLNHHGTPSAGVAVVRYEGKDCRYLILGDITIVAETAGGLTVISDDRVSKTATQERAETDRHLIGTEEKNAALVRMKHAELAARNVPGGYWIAATDPSVVLHSVRGVIDRSSIRRMAILSDGAARIVSLFGRHTWQSMLANLATLGPHKLIGDVRAMENMDPAGEKFPRNKKSDDASVVYAEQTAKGIKVVTRPTEEQRAWALEQCRRDPLFQSASTPGALMGEVRAPGWEPRWRGPGADS